MKYNTYCFALLMCLCANSISANMVTNYGFSYDDTNNFFTGADLDWLSWGVLPRGGTVVDALSAQPDYRLATVLEVDTLMTAFFGATYSGMPVDSFYDSLDMNQVKDFYDMVGITHGAYAYGHVGTGLYGANMSIRIYRGLTYDGYQDLARVILVKNASIPEPSVLALMGLGLIGLLGLNRRKVPAKTGGAE